MSAAEREGLLAHIRELELKVQTLEAVILATHEMAELSLCVARAGVVLRPMVCPDPNPLNDECPLELAIESPRTTIHVGGGPDEL